MRCAPKAWLSFALMLMSMNAMPTTVNNAQQAAPDHLQDCVVLLHGLGRSKHSMAMLGAALERHYHVINISYPSRHHTITRLAELAIQPALQRCRAYHPDAAIYFVTHSLGGILLRSYLAEHPITGLKHSVMLAPPNHGSELADHFSKLLGYRWLMGKPMQQLVTGCNGVPEQLGPANFSVGIIAGSRSYNPLYSAFIAGSDDGKVSIKSTELEGMQDHIVLPVSHSFMMNSPAVQAEILHFLQQGRFIPRI